MVQGGRTWDADKRVGSQGESFPPTGFRTPFLCQGELWAPQGHCLCVRNTTATGNREDTPKTAPKSHCAHVCPAQDRNQIRTNGEEIFRARAQYI